MGKRAACTIQDEASLCADVAKLSLDATPQHDIPVSGPSLPIQDDALAVHRLEWYDKFLPFAGQAEESISDWKASANCGACLYKLGEKKASWDAYKQAALAHSGFKAELSDADLLGDAQFGKYFQTLDREFRADGWSSSHAVDLQLFYTLTKLSRASEVATQRWHIILPNHHFAVMQGLVERLNAMPFLVKSVYADDSRMEFQRANFLALFATPDSFYVETGGAKRAKLKDSVSDVSVEVRPSGDHDFEVEVLEVTQYT